MRLVFGGFVAEGHEARYLYIPEIFSGSWLDIIPASEKLKFPQAVYGAGTLTAEESFVVKLS